MPASGMPPCPKDELESPDGPNPGLRRDWDEQYGDRMQKLVFIGQHLDKPPF